MGGKTGEGKNPIDTYHRFAGGLYWPTLINKHQAATHKTLATAYLPAKILPQHLNSKWHAFGQATSFKFWPTLSSENEKITIVLALL